MRHKQPRIGPGLARLRSRSGLTQQQLGRKARVTVMSISRYENNHSTPNGAILLRLSKALGCTLDEIVGGAKP